ncbi:MAG: hypothetical protein KJI69_05570 [Patescibacteria group bacterium]|nr:hypothetical protein [Patescibacteria group bacterium]
MARRRKSKVPIKGIIPIVLAVAIAFVLLDANACTLKQGVDMSTLDPNDFAYGSSLLPLFCTVLDYNDSEAMGIIIEDFEFDGTQDVLFPDGYTIPFNEPVGELVIEDPDDEGDTVVPIEELEMLQNMTEGTTPIENATEIDPPEMLPPEPVRASEFVFLTEVTKIATDGTNQTETTEIQFIPLELFVEDTSNKDFSQGRLITKLSIRSDPNIFVEGNGKFNVLLDNVTIFTDGSTDFSFSGMTDDNGILSVDFLSPTGSKSPDFLLNIEPIVDDINLSGITPLEFKIFDVTAKVNTFDYEITNEQQVFKFDFFRDPNIILIIDSSGNEVRAFPTDDLFRFGASNGSVTLQRCYKHSRTSCWMTTGYSTSLGSPTIASMEVRNSDGDLLFQNLSPFTATWIVNNQPITRNDTYTVKYGRVTSATAGSLSAGEFTFTTPETQMNYAFRCTIGQSTAVVGSGFCSRCTTTTGNPYITCNFPK